MSVLICDVNGVLLDTTELVREAFAATAARFGFTCFDLQFRAVKGLRLIDAYRCLDPAGDAAARRGYHVRYVRERVGEVRAYPAVAATLTSTKASGVRVCATSSTGEIAEAALVQTGLYPLIDFLVTQEEVPRPKPYPDAILELLRLAAWAGRDADQVIVVGDTVEDIQAGQAAAVRTAGVTYGMSDESEIRGAQPNHIVHAFEQLRPLIARLRSNGDIDPAACRLTVPVSS